MGYFSELQYVKTKNHCSSATQLFLEGMTHYPENIFLNYFKVANALT